MVADLLNSGDDVYVCSNQENLLTNLGKNIPEEDKQNATGALVGISKYSKEFLPTLFAKAEQDYALGKNKYHYEECVFATSQLGHSVHAELCENLNWIEIEFGLQSVDRFERYRTY